VDVGINGGRSFFWPWCLAKWSRQWLISVAFSVS